VALGSQASAAEPTQVPAPPSPPKSTLAPDEAVITPFFMRQLLSYAINLGRSHTSEEIDTEYLIRDSEVCLFPKLVLYSALTLISGWLQNFSLYRIHNPHGHLERHCHSFRIDAGAFCMTIIHSMYFRSHTRTQVLEPCYLVPTPISTTPIHDHVISTNIVAFRFNFDFCSGSLIAFIFKIPILPPNSASLTIGDMYSAYFHI
jgi:hypothetical protein